MTDTHDDPRTKAPPARRVEIFTGAGRRRIWSAAEKARIVAESLLPGTNVSALARAHGLTPAQIFRWRRMNGGTKPSAALSFAPVVHSENLIRADSH
jgi:transposase